jgi:dolichol-phosphate mannosyltransferase
VLTGIPVHDVTSGFVGYRTEVLAGHDLSAFRSEGYAFLMEMKYLLHRSGVRFCEFPITFTEREAGRSKFGAGIMAEGIACPLRIFARRLTGG